MDVSQPLVFGAVQILGFIREQQNLTVASRVSHLVELLHQTLTHGFGISPRRGLVTDRIQEGAEERRFGRDPLEPRPKNDDRKMGPFRAQKRFEVFDGRGLPSRGLPYTVIPGWR